MKIFLPFFNEFKKSIFNNKNHLFYNALEYVPEICGGRYKQNLKNNIFTFNDFIKYSEFLGPRFYLLANSTQPIFSKKVNEICRILTKNQSKIIIANMQFSEIIKNEFPDLKISASCIMSLYINFNDIMENNNFETVCAPQFWNYNVPLMIDNIPEHYKNKVYYIINSGCKWDNINKCKNCYERKSKNWQNIEIKKIKKPCTTRVKRTPLILFNELKKNNFKFCKLQGRS